MTKILRVAVLLVLVGGVTALASVSSAGCSGSHLTQAQSQRGLEAWLSKNAAEPEKVTQNWIEAQVEAREKLGITVSDEMYAGVANHADLACPVAASVVGLQDIPSDNSAKANVMIRAFIDKGRRVESNVPATATFVHYTDGRWVLTSVVWSDGFFSASPNIDVK